MCLHVYISLSLAKTSWLKCVFNTLRSSSQICFHHRNASMGLSCMGNMSHCSQFLRKLEILELCFVMFVLSEEVADIMQKLYISVSMCRLSGWRGLQRLICFSCVSPSLPQHTAGRDGFVVVERRVSVLQVFHVAELFSQRVPGPAHRTGGHLWAPTRF